VVPDNLKAAIVRASFESPLVNRAYRSLAQYYGFLVSACPPASPELKGGVEIDVKYVKGNFLPLFTERQK
jgi:transposase